uniref:DUF3452 domain-containing protein n=1 Tax=Anisakis simplex TaxID=6269 RepID=A0A0M3KHW1_ANISI
LYLSMWQLTPIGHELRFQYPISKLTRICKISVLEFFDKLSRWVAMAGAARRMQEQVSRIQSSLAVSTVVYKKLLPIFRKVFASPQQSSNSPSTSSPSSKEHSEQIKSEQSSKQINCKKIFELLWTLFIAMKSFASVSEQLITDDLMNSFHLLLCSVDFIFQDLRNSSSFQHLLNQDFVNLIPPDEPSALETLCRIFKDVVLDAKHFRAHWWLPKLHSLINEQKVTANAESMNEFVENVDQNIESLNEMYEKAMIRKGEMDERMFIPPDVSTVFDDAFDGELVYGDIFLDLLLKYLRSLVFEMILACS